MKLLLDQNLSYRLVDKIKHLFSKSVHVKDVELENSEDYDIWGFAKENDYAIVTFDADFYDIQALQGHPPKLIWLRFGNTSTNKLIDFFDNNYELIKEFLEDKEYDEIGCLEFS